MHETGSDLLSIPQVASYLDVAERTILMWAQQEKLPAFKIGSMWRFRKSDIDQWLESQRTGPDPAISKDDNHGIQPAPFKSVEREGKIKSCLAAIEASMQDTDREVWVAYSFHLDHGEDIANEAIARLIKTKKIRQDMQRINGKTVSIIRRRKG